MAKERNNRKFDFSKTNEKRFDFTKDELDIVEVPQQPQTGSAPPTSVSGKKSNTGKIVGCIAATIAIFVGINFFGFNDKANVGNDNDGIIIEMENQIGETPNSENVKTTIVIDETNTSEESVTTSEDNKTISPTKVNENIADKSLINETSALQPAKPSQFQQAATSTTGTTSAPESGDVIKIARRVIRGDFGNGEERRMKLGSEYSAIQNKVNEMYAKGLVY